jgi:hypothetical protein
MKFHVQFFLAFAFIAAISVSGVWLYSAKLDSELIETVKACKAENSRHSDERPSEGLTDGEKLVAEIRTRAKANGATEREIEKFLDERIANWRTTKATEVGPWTRYQNDPLVCEPSQLNYASFEPDVDTGNDPQRRVMRSYMAKLSAPTVELTCMFAILLLLFGAIPAGWYFFLQRLREIAEAVRAK